MGVVGRKKNAESLQQRKEEGERDLSRSQFVPILTAVCAEDMSSITPLSRFLPCPMHGDHCDVQYQNLLCEDFRGAPHRILIML